MTPDSPSTTPPSAQEQPQPKIGDFCCFLSSNNNLTEAQVSSVDKDDTGKTYFIVDICGSNTKETVWPEEILPSKYGEGIFFLPLNIPFDSLHFISRGVSAREKQVHIAAAAAAVSPPSSPSTPDAIEPEKEKYPSPTREWCIGDEVRAVYSADGLEYEGNILSLESKDGRPFCVVKFFGYVSLVCMTFFSCFLSN